MAATSIRQVLRYEEQIQNAWLTILNVKGGIPVAALFTQFSSATAVTPRIEINLTSITPTFHRGEVVRGIFTFDAWHAQLVTRVITRRSLNADQHDELIGIVREQALYFRDTFTADLLPFLVMTQIEEQTTHRLIEPDRDEDITELTHKVLFSVRSGSFPIKE